MLGLQTVMAKLLVFAERAVNGLPSANPCLQILHPPHRAMRTNLFFDDMSIKCGAVIFFELLIISVLDDQALTTISCMIRLRLRAHIRNFVKWHLTSTKDNNLVSAT